MESCVTQGPGSSCKGWTKTVGFTIGDSHLYGLSTAWIHAKGCEASISYESQSQDFCFRYSIDFDTIAFEQCHATWPRCWCFCVLKSRNFTLTETQPTPQDHPCPTKSHPHRPSQFHSRRTRRRRRQPSDQQSRCHNPSLHHPSCPSRCSAVCHFDKSSLEWLHAVVHCRHPSDQCTSVASLQSSMGPAKTGNNTVLLKQGNTALRRVWVFYNCVLGDWIKNHLFTL